MTQPITVPAGATSNCVVVAVGPDREEAEIEAREKLRHTLGRHVRIVGVNARLVSRKPPKKKRHVPYEDEEGGGFVVELVDDTDAPPQMWAEEWNFTFQVVR